MHTALSSRTLIFAIKAYRYLLSPFFGQHCRFHPTCSVYAIEAIELHGAWRGTWIAGRRLLRCHPFNEGGVDMVSAAVALRRQDSNGVNPQDTRC